MVLDNDLIVCPAYPNSDPTIRRSYTARLRDTVEMDCTIPVGALWKRYTVQWYKGLIEITNSTSEEFRHITLNENSGALIFSVVKTTDGSKGYFCNVTVARKDGEVSRQGSTITLNVFGKCMQQ